MILESIRAENFKCIEDSNEFSIKPVTCLVGKNEAGKTALLQALYKLKPVVQEGADFDPLRDYPRRKYSEYKERHKANPAGVLTTGWRLEEADLEALGKKLDSKSVKSPNITVTKGYGNKLVWNIKLDEKLITKQYLESANMEQEKISDVERVDLEQCETIAELTEKLKGIDSKSSLLETLNKTFPNGNLEEVATGILESRLPTFLYFGDYQKLPGQVSMEDLQRKESEGKLEFSDRVFLALLDLAGTKAEEINSMGTFERLVAELEAVSNRLTQDIFDYWTQNKQLEVQFLFNQARPEDPPPFNSGYVFRTRIRNTRHGVTVSFDERSAGFVWFFSFLIWFSQVKRNYGENLIILLDDPALNLHARAQQDLLRYINEKLKPKYQVIYTTHSPFMVDPGNLLSARTVEDVQIDGEILGTKVGDKVFSTDADTVLPLQGALGYDITQTLFVGKHTLLIEGPSDLLYLQWFSQELKELERECLDSRWVLTPCGGIDKVCSFVALFGGSKLHAAVFTDFHTGQKRKVKNLRDSNLLRAEHIFSADMYVDQDEADEEDLLGRSLYVSLVNKCYSLDENHQLPENKPADAQDRVLKEVEEHFKTLPAETPEFHHFKPASFLWENRGELKGSLPGIDEALDRFENLFKDLNALLADS